MSENRQRTAVGAGPGIHFNMLFLRAHGRSVNMAILFGLGVVVVAGLGIASVLLARYFNRSADGVLRDYTALAADRLTQAIEIGLARTLYPLINAERTALASADWTPSAEALAAARAVPVPAASTVSSIFVRSPVGPPNFFPAAGPGSGTQFNGTLHDWERQLGPQAYFALEFADNANRLTIYNIERTLDEEVRFAYGAVLSVDSVRATVQAVIRETSALPAHLTDSLPNDSLVSIRITTAEGLPLAEYRLANTLPHRVERKLVSPPGLITTVSLSSGLSKRLVHGAPPGESVWIFGGMAGIAVILLAAAAVLWRQDRRLAHLREQFVAGVSHELRTPLAQIRLFAETLALGRVRDDREVQQAHRVLQQETQRLTHLVENLLVFSRQERDRLLLNRKAVDVSRLVAAIVEEFEPLAQAAHARIMTDIEPGIVAEVDRDAVRQIVLNLLDNAVKYGPDGQIITVRLSSSAERAVLTVEDEGVGVAPQHQARVWERFWRGPDAIRRGKGGSGIGLTVVRDLAEKHGGNAALEAGTSTGACFVVRLPLQLASE